MYVYILTGADGKVQSSYFNKGDAVTAAAREEGRYVTASWVCGVPLDIVEAVHVQLGERLMDTNKVNTLIKALKRRYNADLKWLKANSAYIEAEDNGMDETVSGYIQAIHEELLWIKRTLEAYGEEV